MKGNKLSNGGLRIGLSLLGLCLLVGLVVRFSQSVSSQRLAPDSQYSVMSTGSNGLVQPDGTSYSLATTASDNTDISWATDSSPTGTQKEAETGILEKMIVSSGRADIDIDLNRLNGLRTRARNSNLTFDLAPDSFFTALVFNGELRGPEPGTVGFIPRSLPSLPGKLNASYHQLVLENTAYGSDYEYVIRDGKSGFVFFNIEGYSYNYDSEQRVLTIQEGRLLISKDFADEMGRPSEAGSVIGNITVNAGMRDVEVTKVVNGEVTEASLPAGKGRPNSPTVGTRPGPDVVVGDIVGLVQVGNSSGTQVGLAIGTTSCNFGTVDLNWFALPENDHPVIPQNLYRMSGGASNNDKFEQIGESYLKHAFTALTENICSLGCNNVGGTHLGSGCSDPYSTGNNSQQTQLGSRAWVNPFTGAYPRGDSGTSPNNHLNHTHLGPTHRILTETADLSTTLNAGATYYAEGQYVTPHEYVWCQANPAQCNMNNNVSYKQFSVSGTASPFSFSQAAATVREKPAIAAWTGATSVTIQPAPAKDGVGTVAYKVTNPSAGVWHYEYAVYNQNLDRGIQSFSVPVGGGATVTNIGFHAPPQQPGMANDGTVGSAGYSSAAWAQSQADGALTWSSETFAQNQNANALRWGTLYNFRFDSNRPPESKTATIGFYKTGLPINVTVQGPSAALFSVSGRVTTPDGRGIRGTLVTLTAPGGSFVSVVTNSFGFFTFANVVAGQSYSVSAAAKRFTFTTQVVTVSDNVAGLNLVGQQ